MLVLYPPCIPALNTYNPTATKRIFLKTTDTVASSDERTWTLGVFVPSNLSHVGAIFIAEASCYSLPEEIAKLFSHLPSCLFSHISFVSVKIPLKKIAWLCFLPGVGAGHGCLERPDLLEESESAFYSAKAAAKRCLVLWFDPVRSRAREWITGYYENWVWKKSHVHPGHGSLARDEGKDGNRGVWKDFLSESERERGSINSVSWFHMPGFLLPAWEIISSFLCLYKESSLICWHRSSFIHFSSFTELWLTHSAV